MIIVLFLYFSKSNFEVGGSARFLEGTGGKIGLNVEIWSFSQDVRREFFQVVPDTQEDTILHVFRQNSLPSKLKNHQKKLKNCIFGQISNSSLIFYPLPILGLSFKFYYAPIRSLSKLD